MKRIGGLILVLFACVFAYAIQVPSKGELTFEGNVGFITVGNTNHELKSKKVPEPKDNAENRKIENGEIVAIDSAKTTLMGSVKNINYAKYVVDVMNGVSCEDDMKIKYATLSWGGRSKKEERKSVDVLITDINGGKITDVDPKHITVAEASDRLYLGVNNRGIYACHAEVTDYVNLALTKSGGAKGFRFYVANLETDLTETESPAIGLFSGWTLTVVFEHKGLPERKILIYQPDLLGDVNTTEATGSTEAKANLNCELAVGDFSKIIENDKMSFVSTFLGAYRSNPRDKVYANGNLEEDDAAVLFVHKPESKRNSLDNSVYYKYEFDFAKVEKTSGYYRGYDMNAMSGNFSKCINRTNNTFNFGVLLESEIHFLTDAVLMFGKPDIPGVVARDTFPAANVEPSKKYTYKLYVGLHDNTETQSDLTIRIPLSEYVDSIADIKVKLAKVEGVTMTDIIEHMDVRLLYEDSDEGASITGVDFSSKYNGYATSGWMYSAYNTTTRNKFVSRMHTSDQANFEKFRTNPFEIKDRVLEIHFDSVHSVGYNHDEAITIELDLYTKDKDDWAFRKNQLLEGNEYSAPFVQRSEVTFNTPSNRNSVLQSMPYGFDRKDGKFDWSKYICDQKSRGDGCCGPGPGPGPDEPIPGKCENSSYDGGTANAGGVYTKDTTRIEIAVKPNSQFCHRIDKTKVYDFSFCSSEDVSAVGIREELRMIHGIDLDVFADYDSLAFVDAKQNALYAYLQKYGVSRKDMAGLINFDKASAIQKIKEKACVDEAVLLADKDLEKILNMKIEYTDVSVLYKSKSYGDTYGDSVLLRELKLEDNVSWTFTDTTDVYMFFRSPWNNGSCNDFIKARVLPFNSLPPIVQYGGITLPVDKDTAIRVCRYSKLDTFNIIKNEYYHRIYASWDTYSDVAINKFPEKEFKWALLKSEFDTDVPGQRDFEIYSESSGCKSNPIKFSITVSEHSIEDVPVIKEPEGSERLAGQLQIGFCRSLDVSDLLKLELVDPISGYVPLWYMKTDTSYALIGRGKSINVLKDKEGYAYYSVVYSNDDCVGDKKDEIRVEPWFVPDTLAEDTMRICKDYEIKASNIPDASYMTAGVPFPAKTKVAYYTSMNSTESAVDVAELLDYLNSDANKGNEFTPFYVAAVEDAHECVGVRNTWTINRIKYDDKKPKFPTGQNLLGQEVIIDSALVCIGAKPKSDLTEYLSLEEIQDEDGNRRTDVKYHWYKKGNKKLTGAKKDSMYYELGSTNFDDVIASYASELQGNKKESDTLYVQRIDSMGCVSEPAEFRLHIDTNITSFPFVDDLTRPLVGVEELNLYYCEGANPYGTQTFIPTKPSEDEYVVEWFAKDSATQIVKDTVLAQTEGKIYFTKPDTFYYNVRQRTEKGCLGKWLPVTAVVFPKIDEIPEQKPINLCLGDDPVEVEINNVPAADKKLTLVFYDKTITDPKTKDFKTSYVAEASQAGTFSLVKAMFLSTKTNDVCKSTPVDITYKVNELPKEPKVTKNVVTTCYGQDELDLATLSGAAVNPATPNRYLYWTSDEAAVDTAGKINGKDYLEEVKYYVSQRDKATGCEGEKVEVMVNVDSSFSYKHFDVSLCYGDVIELYNKVDEHIARKDESALKFTPSITFGVYKYNGSTPESASLTATDKVATSAVDKNTDYSCNYKIEVEDATTGCKITDDLSLVFHGLPPIAPLKDIDTCSAAGFKLPFVDASLYDAVVWHRADCKVIAEDIVALTASEKLHVVVQNEYSCKDSSEISVTIHDNPKQPLVANATICRNYGEYMFDVKLDATEGTENKLENLKYYVRDAKGDTLTNAKVKPDTLSFADGASQAIYTYTVYQQNKITKCFSTKVMELTVVKPFTPDFKQIGPQCFTSEVNMRDAVLDYLDSNNDATGVSSIGSVDVAFFTANGGTITDTDASAVARAATGDTTNYYYVVSDKAGVCSVKDSFMVILNEIPKAPQIENGKDTIFLCKNGTPMEISAKVMDNDGENLEIYWENVKKNIKGSTYTYTSNADSVLAYVKNEKTGCISDSSYIKIKAVPVMTAAPHDPITFCAGEKVNLLDTLKALFTYSPEYRSDISYKAYEDGDFISNDDLAALQMFDYTEHKYELKMSDGLTGCNAVSEVDVKWIAPVSNTIVGRSVVCQNDTAKVVEQGETRDHSSKWYLNGEAVGSESSLLLKKLTQDTVVTLVTTIKGTQCKDTTSHKIKVGITPNKLDDIDEPFVFCQEESGSGNITIPHSKYKLEWTREDMTDTLAEKYTVSKVTPDTFAFKVRLINDTAGLMCRSLPIDVTVAVIKHVDVVWEAANLCMPDSVNLKKDYAVDGFDIETISPMPSDPTNVKENGVYTMLYKDTVNGCTTTASVALTFIPKPDTVTFLPKNNFNMCLGDELTVKIKPIASGPYKIEWSNSHTASFFSDTLHIAETGEIKKSYNVVRIDTMFNCRSDVKTLTYAVIDSIHQNPFVAQHTCDYDEINVDSLAKGIFKNYDALTITPVKTKEQIVYTAVNPVSTCESVAKVDIVSHKRPDLNIDGNRVACAGDTVTLAAAGDYKFFWQGVAGSSVLPVTSKSRVDSMIAFRAMLNEPISVGKECWKDTVVKVVFQTMPRKIEGKLDTFYCQNASVDALTLEANDGADVYWYSPTDGYSASYDNDSLTAETKASGKFTYKFKQVLDICETPLQEYSVRVVPKIEVSLKDTFICRPETYNLNLNIQQKVKHLIVQSVSPMPSDLNKVDEPHNYLVTYIDTTTGCTATANTDVQFVGKPFSLKFDENDFNICKGTEKKVAPMNLDPEYKIVWYRDLERHIGDSLKLKTENPTETAVTYSVFRMDTVHNCMSDTILFSYTVKDVIKFNKVADQHICDYETIDLDSLGDTIFVDAKNLDIKYTQTGGKVTYFATNPVSTCTADTSLEIIKHQRPQLSIDGNRTACAGDTVTLTAAGDYVFTWQKKVLGNTLAVSSGKSVDSLITLQAQLKETIDGKNYCYSDTSLVVKFEPVPELIELADTSFKYCQDVLVSNLDLEATESLAYVVWYSDEDGYTETLANQSITPSTDKPGRYVYKFKQILGNCSTKLQDYVIEVQPRITEKPVVSDTAYCIEATPVPLSNASKSHIIGYNIEWLDTDGVVVDPKAYPITSQDGVQYYSARYVKGACKGDTSEMAVTVERRTNSSPEVLGHQRFCPNTGTYTLFAKTTKNKARLNWYEEGSKVRKDSIVVDTNDDWDYLKFTVTQSVLDGCESDPAEVVRVEKKKKVEVPETIKMDICLGNNFVVDELFTKLGYDEDVKIDDVMDAKKQPIDHIINSDGMYYVSVHNDDECEGEFSISVKTWEVGTPKITAPKEIYCIGDSVKITAVAPNDVDYRWFSKNQNNTIGYAETLKTRAGYESDSVFLTMSVSGHSECTATEKFEINVAPKLDFDILGDTALCIGNTFSLAANKITNIKWEFDGELYATETFEFKPEKSGYVTAYGQDQYGCYTSKRALVKVYKNPVPSIILNDTVSSPKYDLDRDDRNILFTAQVLSDENAELHYLWDVGDGNKYTDATFMHEYEYDFVNTIKPIPVTLRVAYDFDDMCASQTSITLRIDPNFHVPNTMVEGDLFMEHYDIQIFDRVGNLIFEGKEGWRGQDMKGKPVFGDTYFYAITYFIEGKKHVKNGYITLVR